MSKKIVIKADLVGKACMSDILSVVASFQGIKSIDIDADKSTLTVVGTVDPVCIALKLKKKCFSANIMSVVDDKPAAPAPEKKPDPDPCKEACEKLCKDKCEQCKQRCERRCKAWLESGCCCTSCAGAAPSYYPYSYSYCYPYSGCGGGGSGWPYGC